jgi:GntR family phosphonate transport system transcriptional regulator
MGEAVLERAVGQTLWAAIAQRLRREIAERYEAGDLLPSEAALAEAFGVARLTLRRAVDELETDGLVRREHGRGVRVLGPELVYAIDRSTRFTLRLEEAGLESRSAVVAAGTIAAEGGVARRLELAPGSPVARIETLRQVGALPLCLVTHFLPPPHGPVALESYREGSLHAFLAERCGLVLERRTSLVTARLPEAEDARLLRQPRSRPILRVKGVNLCARTGRIAEYSVARFRGDRFELLVEASPGPTGDAASPRPEGAVAAPLPPSERDQPGDPWT